MMDTRSKRAEVRNPVLALPAARAFQSLEPGVRTLVAALLFDLQRDARQRAARSWSTRKAFVAAYWATVAVYSGHIARAILPAAARAVRRNVLVVRQPGYPDIEAQDWADASRLYCDRRDASGLGVSRYAEGQVLLAGCSVGRISYNGRIWPFCEWHESVLPIYDNRDAA